VNSLKWLIPGFLLFKGNTSNERTTLALLAFGLCSLLVAVQVVKQMPLGNLLDGTSLQQRANRVLGKNIGYHRVDLAALLAGATWMFYAMMHFANRKLLSFGLLAATGLSFLALLLTGGRAGLVACAAVGFFLSLKLWRKMLIIGPFVLLIALLAIPAVQERVLEGFTEDSHEVGIAEMGVNTVDEHGRDLYAITSGRVVVWPFVVEKFKEQPLIGFGQKAMLREGVSTEIIGVFGPGVAFGHPHNAYLELLIDTGMLGAFPILLFFAWLIRKVWPYCDRRSSGLTSLVAIVCFAFVASQLVASIGSQSFYPREGVVLMWSSIGLFLSSYIRNNRQPA
jgi:O-antigen ligase